MIAELPSGTLVFDQYLIQKVLGQGGCGRTYLAYDNLAFQKPCVLKEFVPYSNVPDIVQKSRELFEREAKVLYELKHPQIPSFQAWLEDKGRLFLVQEYVDGKTYSELLADRTQKGQVFSEAEVIQWLRDLLPVLEHIHTRTQPIIHRDISPDNIMLPKGQSPPMLIDFGAVKLVMRQLQLTATVVTKQGYSAPELRTGKCFPSSDLYSLAVTAAVLLTGKNPRDLLDSNSLTWRWRAYTNVSDRLASILDKMLAEKPQDRYQSDNEVLRELNSTQLSLPLPTPTPTSTPLPTPSPMPWQKITIPLLGALLLGGVACAASPHIEPVCQVLNNCPINPGKEFTKRYESAVEQAKSALLLAENPQSIKDLKDASDRFKEAIMRLNQIPVEAKVYPEAQNLLPNYQSQLQKVEDRIEKEQQAEKLLADAEKIATNALRIFIVDVHCPIDSTQSQDSNVRPSQDQCKCFSNAFTTSAISELEKVRDEWQNAQEILKNIPSDSFITEKVKERKTEYQERVKQIQNWINCQVW